jgi:hypothetical protein
MRVSRWLSFLFGRTEAGRLQPSSQQLPLREGQNTRNCTPITVFYKPPYSAVLDYMCVEARHQSNSKANVRSVEGRLSNSVRLQSYWNVSSCTRDNLSSLHIFLT